MIRHLLLLVLLMALGSIMTAWYTYQLGYRQGRYEGETKSAMARLTTVCMGDGLYAPRVPLGRIDCGSHMEGNYAVYRVFAERIPLSR
jgi:hypothetical protein